MAISNQTYQKWLICIYVGTNGCILIDTLEGELGANEVLEDMKRMKVVTLDKPIKAIIITHSHFDHINGIGYFRRKFPEAQV